MADMDNMKQPAEEPVRIPVDTLNLDDDNDRAARNTSVDALVREYESRYSGFREEESPEIRQAAAQLKPKPKYYPSVSSSNATEEERMWAAIAHGSAIITLLVGMLTGGLATLFTLCIPLGIYFAFRNRSEFVANQALQAFALQALGTVGWVTALTVGLIAGGLLCALLAVTIVGLILVPFVVLAMILFVIASLAMPLGMGVFGAIGAWESYQGKWYRYPRLGEWMDRQSRKGFIVTL